MSHWIARIVASTAAVLGVLTLLVDAPRTGRPRHRRLRPRIGDDHAARVTARLGGAPRHAAPRHAAADHEHRPRAARAVPRYAQPRRSRPEVGAHRQDAEPRRAAPSAIGDAESPADPGPALQHRRSHSGRANEKDLVARNSIGRSDRPSDIAGDATDHNAGSAPPPHPGTDAHEPPRPRIDTATWHGGVLGRAGRTEPRARRCPDRGSSRPPASGLIDGMACRDLDPCVLSDVERPVVSSRPRRRARRCTVP